MKITNLKLENFKFHQKLEFDIQNNLLIYGENGTGKSSIYEALRSNLYINKIKTQDIQASFINRDKLDGTLKVNILFNNGKKINRTDNNLDNEFLLDDGSIFMANEKTLNSILSNKDFYYVIDNGLKYEFLELKELLDIYNAFELDIKRNMNTNNKKEYIDKRFDEDDKFKNTFKEIIREDKSNDIISSFNEDFKIEFIISSSEIDENNKLIRPTIRLKIKNQEDNHNLQNHFNEAKLKLISIAIYFSLVKRYEIEESELKVLVLDDFLTSLDMANRKLIIQYILDEFEDYQKIILTHNIQFFNIIINLLKSRDELENNWDIKNLFFRKTNNNFESIIYDKETNYLKIAEQYLEENKLSESGNFLRKEFERIIEELRQICEIGTKEKLGNIVDNLIKIDINNQYKYTTTFKNNIVKMQKILKKAKFYQDSILHSASHDDSTIEIYKKDCEGAVVVLKNLKKYIKVFKKENNE
jgi:hypothetical protein